MQYFEKMGVTSYTQLISFDQNDTFGQAGYSGLTDAYLAELGAFPGSVPDPINPIARFRYTRNDDTSVPAQAAAAESYIANQLGQTTGTLVIGVMMTDTYGAAAGFIQALRATGSSTVSSRRSTRRRASTLYFSNVSFVGPNALSSSLTGFGNIPGTAMPYTTNVVVSQVVPNYQHDESSVVQQYNG